MISSNQLQEITRSISEIETLHKVRVLYACESGSRAWGFPSTDSDYDVRFIYAYSSDAYLCIDDVKEQIDIPVNEVLDINGWDIRKALKLFRSSNATLYEWLQSPIVYKANGIFAAQALALMPQYFSLKDGLHHYMGMTKKAYSALEGDEIRLKKYFYCLRALLSAMWIVQKRELPPMEFGELRGLVADAAWNAEINALLHKKAEANESTIIKAVPVLQAFIDEHVDACNRQSASIPMHRGNDNELNDLFKRVPNEV